MEWVLRSGNYHVHRCNYVWRMLEGSGICHHQRYNWWTDTRTSEPQHLCTPMNNLLWSLWNLVLHTSLTGETFSTCELQLQLWLNLQSQVIKFATDNSPAVSSSHKSHGTTRKNAHLLLSLLSPPSKSAWNGEFMTGISRTLFSDTDTILK